MKNKCYWCGKDSTSREHVPPKCLFPERKDMCEILDQDFKNNLITVPSCDEHNLRKSNDDEYLMACISSKVGNNKVAYFHTATKVSRAIKRTPSLLPKGNSIMVKAGESIFPIGIIEIDIYRLIHSFESITRGLYFYEFSEQFVGSCRVISDIFLNPKNEESNIFISRSIESIKEERALWNTKVNGENPIIFTYQFSPKDGFGMQTLVLTFYERTTVYVIMRDVSESNEHKSGLQFASKIMLGI